MLSNDLFMAWWRRFKTAFPTVGDYVARQENSTALLEVWNQVLGGFTLETLEAVTDGLVSGRFELIPNTQLGQFAHEIRQRAKHIVEEIRRREPQTWQQTDSRFSPTRELAIPHMNWMFRCALAADTLLGVNAVKGVKVYRSPHSVQAKRGSHDAAIIMADEHTAIEEEECLATFARDRLTWDQIYAEACKIQEEPSIVHQVPAEES